MAVWAFRWLDGGWHRVPVQHMERLVDGEAPVDRPEDGFLTVTVLVKLENRVPVSMAEPHFDRWPLTDDGTVDQKKLKEGASVIIGSLFGAESEGNVVNATAQFAHRRHLAQAKWSPTREQRVLLSQALRKAGVSADLAELVVSK